MSHELHNTSNWLRTNCKFATLSEDTILWYSKYAINMAFPTEEEARAWLYRIRRRPPAWGTQETEQESKAFCDQMPLYKKYNKWKIGKPIRKKRERLTQSSFKVKKPDQYELAHIAAANGTNYDIDYNVQWIPTRLLLGEGSDIYSSPGEDSRIRNLAQQIKQSGWIEAIVAGKEDDGAMWVVEGQHRTRAMKYLGLKSVPAVIVEFHNPPNQSTPEQSQPVQTTAWVKGNCRFANAQLAPLLPQLIEAAQKIYNEWDQSGPDGDVELGFGGICQDIADAQANILASNGFDASPVSASVGDQHVFVVTALSDGVYMIDIAPSYYETGGGYNWQKIPNVVFTPAMIDIVKLSDDPLTFDQYLE